MHGHGHASDRGAGPEDVVSLVRLGDNITSIGKVAFLAVQPHLGHDVCEFAGSTPGDLLKACSPSAEGSRPARPSRPEVCQYVAAVSCG